MSQAIQSESLAQVESIARVLPPSARDDFRLLMTLVFHNLTALSPGGNLVQIGGPQKGASAAPTGVTHSVTGANGVANVNISNPPAGLQANTPIFHQVRYSSLKSFTQDVTMLDPTTATSIAIPQSGVKAFYQLRSSYDKVNWTPFQFPTSGPVAVDAGLVESEAMSSGGAFNQSNFAEVNSQANGTTALVTISGTGGDLTSYVATRGEAQRVRPSATIVGVEPQSEQFVGFDGSHFYLKPTLAGVLSDDLEPVGKVSVVSTSPPTTPTIVPIVTGGGVVGFDVTDGGAGASQPYTLSVVGAGTGATCGAQVIVAGVLISVAPGNAGSGYGSGTSVAVSGGGPGGGSSGGGTSAGGNGARMSNV